MPLPQAWSSLEVSPGPTGNKPSQQQKVEAEPCSAGPTGLCPWSEVKGSHPSPVSPCSPLQPHSPHPLPAPLPCGSSPLPASPGKPLWGSEKASLLLQGADPTVHHSPVPTVRVALACLAPSYPPCPCLKASAWKGLAQGWVVVHFHGAGVSELARMDEHRPAWVTGFQEPRRAPGKAGQRLSP